MAPTPRTDPFERFFRDQDAKMRAAAFGGEANFVPLTGASFRLLLERHEAYDLPAPNWARVLPHKPS